MRHGIHIIVGVLVCAPAGQAGLYYSGETFAELPSQWRGFLLDQRMLRNVAFKPTPAAPAGPARLRYQEAADRLATLAHGRPLSADEAADLGALDIRLGEAEAAIGVLRAAQARWPTHFRIAANLGTAWQLHGDLSRAAAALSEAVRLAPAELKSAEELHLKLVRLRQRQVETQGLDDLFGVRYGTAGAYRTGALGANEREKLSTEAVALTQRLALWLPADGKLLWQLAEMANAYGDVRAAASMMDGCVREFGMNAADLRAHRQACRAAADALATPSDAKAAHQLHASAFPPRSKRPLLNRSERAELPAIHPNGINSLPWAVLGETSLDRQFHPTFLDYLRQLDGKQVTLDGFMQPLGEDVELTSFMLIEYPVGCWYCEMPEVTGIVLVEMPAGQTATYSRERIRVSGTLRLNASDPENFLYTITKAQAAEAPATTGSPAAVAR